MGNMREISIEECNAVFGGTDDIVVSGRRPVPGSTNFTGTYGYEYGSSIISAGIMSNPEVAYDPDTEDNAEEIVVTAQIPLPNQILIREQAKTITNGLIIMGAILAGPIVVEGTALIAALTPALGAGTAIVVTGRALHVGGVVGAMITSDIIENAIYETLAEDWLKDYQDDGKINNSHVYQTPGYKHAVDQYNEAAKEWNERMTPDGGQGFWNPDD